MSFLLTLFLVFANGCSTSISTSDPHFPGDSWEQHPLVSAWDTDVFSEMHAYAETAGSMAYMVIADGYVVDQWGDVDRKEIIQSARKSILSGLYGPYVEKKILSLDATMADLGIDDIEPLSWAEKMASVRQLLQARSGVYHPSAASTPSMLAGLPERNSRSPGSFWYYNNWDFNVLGTIFNQETGQDVFQALYTDIAQPIGMEDFQPSDGWYMRESMSDHPAYHMWMSARDMARFGLLFARNGEWDGRQIIPASWVLESTTSYSEAEGGGYGYMWWTDIPSVPEQFRSFAARGGRGHMILVVPELDLVFVHRNSNQSEMQPHWGNVNRLIEMMFEARGEICSSERSQC